MLSFSSSQARQASYTAKDVEAIPRDLLERYFEQGNQRFTFRKDLRRSMIFGRNDLTQDAPISRIRGVVHDYRGGARLIPTFHPAFLLRSPEHKREVWEDMKKVLAILAEDD